MTKHLLFLLVVLSLVPLPSFASDTPTAGGIFPPLQYPAIEDSVFGLRISPGWARNKEMYGFDFGLIGNITDSRFIGMGLSGGFNATSGETIVLLAQMALVANSNYGKASIVGIQWALGYNYAGGTTDIYGAQMSLIGNFGTNNIYGVQLGIYNRADHVYGFQIGVINHAKNLHGIQIGLLNHADNGLLPVFPVINIGF